MYPLKRMYINNPHSKLLSASIYKRSKSISIHMYNIIYVYAWQATIITCITSDVGRGMNRLGLEGEPAPQM